MNNCLNCKKTTTNKLYCTNFCQQQYKKNNLLQQWLKGEITGLKKGDRIISVIREFLLKENNYRCSKCGWNKLNVKTNKCPLEINHIDGNCKNNIYSNLEVLCPNCHSLTSNWKALNRGNASKERLKYSKLRPF